MTRLIIFCGILNAFMLSGLYLYGQSTFSNGLQKQPTFSNKEEMFAAKKAFPNTDFVDINRKITISVERSDAPDIPFYWKVEEEVKRISVSNQTMFSYGVFLTDFHKGDKAKFVVVNDKEMTHINTSPNVKMVEREGMFHTNFKYKFYLVPVTRPGAILEARSSFLLTSYAHLSELTFLDKYPALHSEIIFEIPKELKVRFDSLHFDQANIQFSKELLKNKTIYRFKRDNVEAGKEVRMAPNSIYYEPHILVFAEQFTTNKGDKISLLSNVEDIYRWNRSMAERTKNEVEGLRGLVDSLTTGKSDEEKLRSLYYWVQDNIRYLAFENGLAAFVPDACQEVYFKRYGDCKGKSNLLKQMLLLAGFDSRLVWIGTKDHSFLAMTQPSISPANHMITAVKWKDNWLFLDPTTNFYGLYQIPDQLQGKTAMIEGDAHVIVEQLPFQSFTEHYENSRLELQLSAGEEQLVGRQKRYLSGNPASDLRTELFTFSGKNKTEVTKNILTYNNLNIGYKNESFDIDRNRDKPIQFESDIILSNQIIKLDNQLLLPTTVFPRLNSMSISEKRREALSLSERLNFNDTIVYNLPDKYELEYLPDSVEVKRDKYSFVAKAKLSGNQIELICSVRIEDFILLKSDFEQWNKDYAALLTFNKNRIILNKK